MYDNEEKAKILLESGTNELEIMEFTISGELFGINVAKVREIMMAQEVKMMPNSHEVVEGVFKPRSEIITVIDLGKYLNMPKNTDKTRDIFIVTHFNNLNFAFHVDSVVGIDRISWTEIKKGLFPWTASGRAIANGRDEGITKLLFDDSPEAHGHGKILGGGIVGTHAGDMIGEIALAIEMGADAVDIGKTIHPHPTLGESIGMAAEIAHGSCTDVPPQRK